MDCRSHLEIELKARKLLFALYGEKGSIWYDKKQIQLQVLQEASKKASWSLLETRRSCSRGTKR